jgi:hypothetical protein
MIRMYGLLIQQHHVICQVLWVRVHNGGLLRQTFTMCPYICSLTNALTGQPTSHDCGTSPVSWLYHRYCGDIVSGQYKNNFKIYLFIYHVI